MPKKPKISEDKHDINNIKDLKKAIKLNGLKRKRNHLCTCRRTNGSATQLHTL